MDEFEEEEEEEIDPTDKHLPSPSVLSESLPSDKKELSGSHKRRKAKRDAEKAAKGQIPRSAVKDRYVKNSIPIDSKLDFADAPATAGAYSAKRKKINDAKVEYSLDELRSMGLQIISWDGMYV